MDFKAVLGEKYHDGMSAEELIAALQEANFSADTEEKPDESFEIKRMRAALDKASKEAAENKRQLRAYQAEVNAGEAERQNRQIELETIVKNLEKKSATQEYINRLNKISMKDDDAADMANSLYGASDPNGVLTVLESYAKNLEAEMRRKILQETPRPEVGGGNIEETERLRMENDMRMAMGLPTK